MGLVEGCAFDNLMSTSSTCSICQGVHQPSLTKTRSAKKDYWICCDSCKSWFHAGCGGFTVNQYHKITKENIWIKCVVCCLHQVQLTVSEADSISLYSSVEEAVKRRGCESSRVAHRDDNNNKHQNKQEKGSEVIPNSDTRNVDSVSDITQEVVQTSQIDGNGYRDEDAKVTVSCESDIDKVLVIDNIHNAVEYSSSRRILQEVHKYCPNIKVDFAYSLARGGVAIHTALIQGVKAIVKC